MLRSNESLLQTELNKIRKNPKKFICLNDNFDHNENSTMKRKLKKILNDFYTSLFPIKSVYELDGETNPFLYIDDYQQWRDNAKNKWNIFYNLNFLFILFNVISLIILFVFK